MPAGLHPSARKSFGPYYLVPLLDNGTPAVMLAVSAYNTSTEIGEDGQLVLPRLDGNGFIGAGVPTAHIAVAAISPEEAVAQAARASKRRVTAVPELVLPGAAVLPVFAMWKVALESEVPMSRKGEQGVDHARALYVGRAWADDFRLPKRVQRMEETRTVRAVDAKGQVGADVTFRVPVRPGESVEFDVVTPQPEDR